VILTLEAEVGCKPRQKSSFRAEVAELADARDSKSREVTPHVGSIPTFGTRTLHLCQALFAAARMEAKPRVRRAPKVSFLEMF
jgi:hypothetical protein